jgi:hypothetical protein
MQAPKKTSLTHPLQIADQTPRPRFANPGAQTRMVSAGQLQLQQQELSHNLKYMACGRISEFESSHPSHAVKVSSYGCKRSWTACGGESHAHEIGLVALRIFLIPPLF